MGGDGTIRSRGVLYPARLPSFTRLHPPALVADHVRWFWIPEWDLPPGRTARQEVIAYPATNLVVDATTTLISGPTTRLSHRELSGSGWAVGALLRPAAIPDLAPEPSARLDSTVEVDTPELREAIADAMTTDRPDRLERAVDAFAAWISERTGPVSDEARLINALADLIENDPGIIRVEDAGRVLGASTRTLQRLARTHVGIGPAEMIRRRRLQTAAERIRDDPGADLSRIAAELGYSDHAHLTREFRDRLGFTPSTYRARS